MKVVAYLRCSGIAGSQSGADTWDRQQDKIKEFVSSHSHQLIHEYREEDVKGKTGEDQRPAFQEMVTALLSNGCRTVVVENLSRLAREYRIQEQLLIYLSAKGISIVSADTGENITEAMMGDPMRRAMVQFQGIIFELEKNMLVAKLTHGKKRFRELHGRCEGRKGYGQHPDRPQEKETLSLMVSLSKDRNPSEIAAELNSRGIKTRSGGDWFPNGVRRILARAA